MVGNTRDETIFYGFLRMVREKIIWMKIDCLFTIVSKAPAGLVSMLLGNVRCQHVAHRSNKTIFYPLTMA
ncbi:MAG: hypothetical protein ACI4DR_08530 [Roseburia sp.]